MATNTVPPRKAGMRGWQWLVIIFAILLLGAFLLGYIPESQKANRLASELQTAQNSEHQQASELQIAKIRDGFIRAYLETAQNNFGLASQHATQAFDQLTSAEASVDNPQLKTALQDVAGRRAAILAKLGKADESVRTDLAGVLETLYKAAGQ